MRNYFKAIDKESLRKEYKDLAKIHHPDLGGSVEVMKVINLEYEFLLKNVLYKTETLEDIEAILKNDKELREKLDKVISIINRLDVEAEICGTWLWVEGDTKEIKEDLKNIGLRWARTKKAWYFHSGEFSRRSKKTFSLGEIRTMHGSIKINERKKLYKIK